MPVPQTPSLGPAAAAPHRAAGVPVRVSRRARHERPPSGKEAP